MKSWEEVPYFESPPVRTAGLHQILIINNLVEIEL
jgi:hypothetical protein